MGFYLDLFPGSIGKKLESAFQELRVGVFFWYGLLASFSLQIANVASGHHGQNKGALRAARFWRVTCKQMT